MGTGVARPLALPKTPPTLAVYAALSIGLEKSDSALLCLLSPDYDEDAVANHD